MKQTWAILSAALVMAASGAVAQERVRSTPFALPSRAKVAQTAADGKGWAVNGEISAAGWMHLHTIPLGRDRNLEAWSRGDKELTLMTWRIAAGKSGFSYGISSKAGAADAKPAVGRRRPDVQSRRPAGRAIPKGKK